MVGDRLMIFNDDSLLDVGGAAFGGGLFGRGAGFDAGEVIITGRVPGSLYADDLLGMETFLEHLMPIQQLSDDVAVALEVTDASVITVVDIGDLPAAANDDAPESLALVSHAKDAEPLVLIPGGDEGVVVDTVVTDLHDLTIPPIPLSASEAPVVTVTPPTADLDPAPVVIGGRAYESLSFLIIDTPFAVGDNQLPETLRPSIEALLGLLGSDNDDDGQAFVMPARSWVLG